MSISIGIDVSQDFLDVASFDGTKFKVTHYDTNNKQAFKKILKDFDIDKKKDVITMEVTGVYHLQLAHNLSQKGYQVSVVNPFRIKKYSEMKMKRAKTDKADAKTIAQYGYAEPPSLYKPRPVEREKILMMLKGIEDMLQTQQQYRNRLHSLFKHIDEHKIMRKHYQSLLKQIEKHIKALELEIEKLVKTFAPKEYTNLKTIKGVGKKTATAIIGYFGDFKDFETAKQAVAFTGLNPNPRESGKSVKNRATISKKGHAYLRKLLYLGALTAKKHNPKCQELFDRLLSKGHSPKYALVAVANKLMRQIFAIGKHGRVFELDYDKMC